MEKMDNYKMRVTGCIADRFAVMFETDTQDADVENVKKYAHNCALALDFIGAGKIRQGEAYNLMLRCLNDEFKDEEELLGYIAQVRAERKKRVLSDETKNKRKAIKLAEMGFNSAQIAGLLPFSETEVNEILRESHK